MITRRDVARAAAMTALSYSRVLGANDRIGLGVIGTGERGTYVMSLFQKNPDVEVRALCDVYAARIDEAQHRTRRRSSITGNYSSSRRSTPFSSALPTTGTGTMLS